MTKAFIRALICSGVCLSIYLGAQVFHFYISEKPSREPMCTENTQTTSKILLLTRPAEESPYVNIELDYVDNEVQIIKRYSSFRVPRPNFIDNKSEVLFDKRDWNHPILENLQTSESYFGDVHIVKDGRFDTYPFCGHKGKKNWIKRDGNVKPTNWFKVLIPLTLVDGGTFQHFQDQVLLRLLQVLPIVRAHNATLLMYTPRDKILYEIYEQWNITSQIIFMKDKELYGADYLIHTCILDSLHPMVWRESRRVMGVQMQLMVPMEDAYVIVLTRKGCFNCGRVLINQDQIVEMLHKRYGKQIVKVFEGPKPLKYSLELFGKARIVIGGHGGGFYNLIYAPEKTVVVEFMPTKDDGTTDIPGEQIFFKMASIMHQEYWRVAVPPKERKNMEINIPQLQMILDVVDKKQLKSR